MSGTIVIIGAGPVGLYTGIQIKLLNDQKNIIMFEKHEIYQRTHTVKLAKESFNNSVCNSEFQQLLNSFGDSISTSELRK